MQRSSDCWLVVQGGTTASHQCPGTSSNKTSFAHIHHRHTKSGSIKSIPFQIDNKTTISYLLKMWGTTNQTMIALSKEIWEVLLKKNRTISAEYLPSALSKEADWESRNSRDSSDWKLCPLIFQRIKSRFGHPQIDLFTSHLCHQLENCLFWRPDPRSKGWMQCNKTGQFN